jgi:hypothetical protein
MSLTESQIEEAAIEWLWEHCRFSRTLTRPLSLEEGNEREAIRRMTPAFSLCTLASLNDTLLPNLLSGEMSILENMIRKKVAV